MKASLRKRTEPTQRAIRPSKFNDRSNVGVLGRFIGSTADGVSVNQRVLPLRSAYLSALLAVLMRINALMEVEG